VVDVGSFFVARFVSCLSSSSSSSFTFTSSSSSGVFLVSLNRHAALRCSMLHRGGPLNVAVK
jgi:hypothetical protein